MSLSDDVASLKVEIHKLAVAIEELAIRRYAQGEIDISKLPWFTPQYLPGDSIRLSSSRVPTATAYPENNELITSPTPSFLNTSDISLGADKVFDEISERSYNLDQVQLTRTNSKDTQNPPRVGSFVMHCLNIAESEVQQPMSFNPPHLIMTTNGVNKLEQNVGSVDKNFDEFESQTECNLVKESRLSSAQKVLDELPLPTFIKEMAEAAKIAELDSIPDDSDTIYEDYDDLLAYKQIFAKLGTLDDPDIRDLVVIGATRERFSTLQCTLSRGCYPSDQMSQHCNVIYGENLYSHCPSSQVSMDFVKNVICPLLYGDIEWFMRSDLSTILGVEACDTRVFILEHGKTSRMTLSFELDIDKRVIAYPHITFAHVGYGKRILADDFGNHTCMDTHLVKSQYKSFDPGINLVLCYNFTLEDKGDLRGEECTWELTKESVVFLTYVFDISFYRQCDLWDNPYCLHVTDMEYQVYRYVQNNTDEAIEVFTCYWKFGDDMCMLGTIMPIIDSGTNQRSLPTCVLDMGVGTEIIPNKIRQWPLVQVFETRATKTLMYGIYAEHVECSCAATFSQIEVCVPLQLLQSDIVWCIPNCSKLIFQVSNYDPDIMMKIMIFVPTGFGADQLKLLLHKFTLARCNGLAFIASVNYIPLAKFQHGDTLGKTWTSIACDAMFQVIDASRSFTAYTILSRVFDPGGIKGVNIMSTFKLFKENSRWGKECARSRCYFLMIMPISSFIFDPGGSNNCWPMMMDLLAYQNEGNQLEEKTYENNQCYVFDPGGLLSIQDVNVLMRRVLVFDPVECVMVCLVSNITCL